LQTTAPPSANSTEAHSSIRDTPRIGLLGPIHPLALAHHIRGPDPVPNFINPFWMLPLLGILGLKSKDLIGFTSVQFLIHFPIVIVLASCLMTTFAYHPPVMPLIPQRQSPYEY